MRHQANAGKALTDVRRPVAVDTHGRRGGRRRLIPADFVLAVTVLIGTIVIRSVLLQAVMAVLGERYGCLPRRLPWLPRLGLDAPAAPKQATAARPALTPAPSHRRPIKIRAAGSGGEGPQPSECAAAGAADTTLSTPAVDRDLLAPGLDLGRPPLDHHGLWRLMMVQWPLATA